MPSRPIERVALGVVWIGIGLALLIPFVISGESAFFPLVVNGQFVLFPPTIFPFLVGKELLFRCIVEIVLVAWTVLAVVNPAYRPRRSLLLGLLGLALAVALVSALAGVSTSRSLFSTYERMGGVVGQAHWFVFALVLVSVVRMAEWRTLLNASLAAGMVMALWALGQYYDVGALLWEGAKEGYGRVTATLGNPIHLGAYLLVNALVATGFLVESLTRKTTPGREGETDAGTSGDRVGVVPALLARLFWAFGAFLSAWVVTLTAARSAFLGLAAGVAAVAFLFSFLERGRVRLLAGTLATVLAAVPVLFAVMVATYERDADSQRIRSANPLIERTLSFSKLTVETRLAAWDAAAEGFLAKPLFGWGPENYIVVLGRHADGVGADMRAHDNAHGRLAEEVATKGALGVLSHLAIWAALLLVGLRAAARMGRRERIPLVFSAGALVGYFAQALVSPEVVTGILQFTLLFAFVAVASRETGAPPWSWGFGKLTNALPKGLKQNLLRVLRRPTFGVIAIALSATLAGVGLWANKAAFSAAAAGGLAIRSSAPELGIAPHRTRQFFMAAIDGYEPMANQFRLFLFQYAGNRWRFLRTEHRTEAARLLALVDAQAPLALRAEPENWEVPLTLAQTYSEVAKTDPEYRAVAARQVAAARRLAPNRYEVRALASSASKGRDRAALDG